MVQAGYRVLPGQWGLWAKRPRAATPMPTATTASGQPSEFSASVGPTSGHGRETPGGPCPGGPCPGGAHGLEHQRPLLGRASPFNFGFCVWLFCFERVIHSQDSKKSR